MSVMVIATIIAKPIYVGSVQKALSEIVALSRGEKGCLTYLLNRDPAKHERFYIVEHWQNQHVLDQHSNSKHFQQLLTALENKIELMDVQCLENLL